jgi:hypothetical protein
MYIFQRHNQLSGAATSASKCRIQYHTNGTTCALLNPQHNRHGAHGNHPSHNAGENPAIAVNAPHCTLDNPTISVAWQQDRASQVDSCKPDDGQPTAGRAKLNETGGRPWKSKFQLL